MLGKKIIQIVVSIALAMIVLVGFYGIERAQAPSQNEINTEKYFDPPIGGITSIAFRMDPEIRKHLSGTCHEASRPDETRAWAYSFLVAHRSLFSGAIASVGSVCDLGKDVGHAVSYLIFPKPGLKGNQNMQVISIYEPSNVLASETFDFRCDISGNEGAPIIESIQDGKAEISCFWADGIYWARKKLEMNLYDFSWQQTLSEHGQYSE